MGLNTTPSAERVHIGIFGRRNAGKSSLINAITGQDLAIVSPIKGTTTDPVSKAMELLPLGPVVVIDTPGLDDEGELGAMRIKKSYQVLDKTDIAIIVLDGTQEQTEEEAKLIAAVKQRKIPYLLVYNKLDLLTGKKKETEDGIWVSAATGEHIGELKEKIARLAPASTKRRIVGDILSPGDLAVLVVPIDEAAPKGRLILPQQQTIRDILDADAEALVVQDRGLKRALEKLKQKPRIVITDSQAFGRVAKDTPRDIPLTSFSILFARYKGDLIQTVQGAKALKTLRNKDKVLVAEGCTHHRQCNDIGTVKIPGWVREFTGIEPEFVFVSGTEFPQDLSEYQLVIHCGGCMLNQKEMESRLVRAKEQGVPIVNYGILIAYIHGILERSLEPFPEVLEELES